MHTMGHATFENDTQVPMKHIALLDNSTATIRVYGLVKDSSGADAQPVYIVTTRHLALQY
eukprot:3416906-Amphidinium_carterae.1